MTLLSDSVLGLLKIFSKFLVFFGFFWIKLFYQIIDDFV